MAEAMPSPRQPASPAWVAGRTASQRMLGNLIIARVGRGADGLQAELASFASAAGLDSPASLLLPDGARQALAPVLDLTGAAMLAILRAVLAKDRPVAPFLQLSLGRQVTAVRQLLQLGRLFKAVPMSFLAPDAAEVYREALVRSTEARLDRLDALLADGRPQEAAQELAELLGVCIIGNTASQEAGARLLRREIRSPFSLGDRVASEWDSSLRREEAVGYVHRTLSAVADIVAGGNVDLHALDMLMVQWLSNFA